MSNYCWQAIKADRLKVDGFQVIHPKQFIKKWMLQPLSIFRQLL
jgi:hypothetical protein